MPKNIILDTTVLLHDPHAVFTFPESNLLIPIEVIEEIDGFKRDMDERGRNSRTAARILDGLRERGRLGEGVALDNGSLLRVICESVEAELPFPTDNALNRVDNSILGLAVHFQARRPDEQTVVVTKNVNLRLKADALGIPAQDYAVDRTTEPDVFPGWRRIEADTAQVRGLGTGREIRIPGVCGPPNEFVLLESPDGATKPALGRFAPAPPPDAAGGLILPLEAAGLSAVGVRPLNLEQTFALAALLIDDFRLVTLTGKAGTGKTLLAVAAGLQKVFTEDRYNRVLIFRPTLPVGKDLGYLPGSVDEKMRPWMQPVYDALELIREQDRRNPVRALPPDIMECEEIRIEPLTYIRGRSIPHQYIIIDEAQNLTPLEVKTVITRVGRGTKVVLTGDPHQIDNPYVDAQSNGLTYLVGHFQTSPLAAHVALWKGERSELAEAAANLL
ncbi:MAG: PhoH family protein [Kiritimatiellaeota bacterium]|nr:PhoH family protein [Kiritimatiellota bacterium]